MSFIEHEWEFASGSGRDVSGSTSARTGWLASLNRTAMPAAKPEDDVDQRIGDATHRPNRARAVHLRRFAPFEASERPNPGRMASDQPRLPAPTSQFGDASVGRDSVSALSRQRQRYPSRRRPSRSCAAAALPCLIGRRSRRSRARSPSGRDFPAWRRATAARPLAPGAPSCGACP